MAEINLDAIERFLLPADRTTHPNAPIELPTWQFRALVRAVRAAMALYPEAEVWSEAALRKLYDALAPFRKEAADG